MKFTVSRDSSEAARARDGQRAIEGIDIVKEPCGGRSPIAISLTGEILFVSFNRRGCGRLRDPFRGTGKPEPLRRNLSGWWSRRITAEHRLVYRVTGKGEAQALKILSLRYHV